MVLKKTSGTLPSIVLRYPGEADDEHSEYAQAIMQISETHLPLSHLIKKRIVMALAKPFEDKLLEETIALRMDLNETIRFVKDQYPTFDINAVLARKVKVPTSDSQRAQLDCLVIALAVAKSEKNKLHLNTFTGLGSWKTKDSIYWVETSETEAKRIGGELRSMSVMDIHVARRVDNPLVWVIKVENIKEQALNALVEKQRTERTKGLTSSAFFAAKTADQKPTFNPAGSMALK